MTSRSLSQVIPAYPLASNRRCHNDCLRAHHPAASRVLDAISDDPAILPRSWRALLRAMEPQFTDIIDDRIGARVGMRCWTAADPYLKVRYVAYSESSE